MDKASIDSSGWRQKKLFLPSHHYLQALFVIICPNSHHQRSLCRLSHLLRIISLKGHQYPP